MFWATALGAPLLVITFNAFVRWACRLEPSSFADVILMFVVFDVLILAEHKHVEHYILNQALREGITVIYPLLLVINMFAWILAAFYIEERLAASYDARRRRYRQLPWLNLAQSWGLSGMIFFANLASFAYRGS